MNVRKYTWMVQAILELDFQVKTMVIYNFMTARKKYAPDKKVGDLLTCALCPNMCRFECPVLDAAKSETFSPSGKARIAYALERGALTSEEAAEILYACVGCSACKEWCPFHFSVEDILLPVREGRTPPPPVRDLRERLLQYHSVYENGVTSLGERKGDVLYVGGCTVLNRTREIAEATLSILERVHVATLPEEWCCGAPLFVAGATRDFLDVARHNAHVMKAYRTVVCSCPECVYIFRNLYKAVGVKVNAEVLHTTQVFARLLREGKLKTEKRETEYVYHDPCVLARKLGVVEEPRELIRSAAILKEADFNRKLTRCCGMGGMLSFTYPELSSCITKRRVAELGGAVVTACPTCKVAFRRENCTSYDIAEVIQKSMEGEHGRKG